MQCNDSNVETDVE